MKRTVFLYGVILASIIAILKAIEYNYYLQSLSLELYLLAVGGVFVLLGVWIGIKLGKDETAPPERLYIKPNENLKLSKREREVLCLMAQGYSNQEIAEKLFVSIHTIKTHSSNLFSKLQVKRRTQAIQKAIDFNILTN